MKRNRILALALAVCLCAALVVPASAAPVTFTDITGSQWDWARPSIQTMTDQGLFTGYGDNTFRPADSMKRIEGLALCARVTQGTDTRYQIAADQSDVLDELFPKEAPNWWFRKEAATCMALGVETAANFSKLYGTGGSDQPIYQPMTKAEFAMYLVRGMGLEELAQSIDASELPFDDAASISARYRPYVKVLASYGVLTGDENHNFNPDQSMTRAVCATMLARSIEHIVVERKVSVELPQYTKYAWTSGIIQEVDPIEDGMRALKLRSEITGEETVYLQPTTKVYQYNKEDQFTALKTGAFAKVCYATDGKKVDAVRVIPADLVDVVKGDCGEQLSTNEVIIDGVPYAIDRFTQVSAGGKTGDRSIIDYAANYTHAEAGVNTQGTALWLKLSGGTRLVEGILTDLSIETVGLSERVTITVSGYNGTDTTYTVPESADVIVNGDAARLTTSQVGRQVILRVSDADLSDVKAVEVNMTDRFVQGILRNTSLKTSPVWVEIKGEKDAKANRYEVADDCVVTYRGADTTLEKLALSSFVTAKVEGGTVTSIYAWQGYEDTEGTLTGLIYATNATTLEVTRADDTVVRFNIPLEELNGISVTSGGKEARMTGLKTGDQVVITVLYNSVTQIDFTSQAANVSGTLESINRKIDGTAELTVKLTNGTSHTYTATVSTTVIQGGKPVTLSSVNPGGQVSLVTEGDRAVSIEITGTASRQDSVYGSVYSQDNLARIATILVTENGETKPVDVHIASGVTITTVDGDALTNISRLKQGDVIQVWGSYVANSDYDFEAKLVVRE